MLMLEEEIRGTRRTSACQSKWEAKKIRDEFRRKKIGGEEEGK